MGRGNIKQRAARYFGMEDAPRVSVQPSRYKVVIAARRNRDLYLLSYSEDGREPDGEWARLRGGDAQLLADFLTGEEVG